MGGQLLRPQHGAVVDGVALAVVAQINHAVAHGHETRGRELLHGGAGAASGQQAGRRHQRHGGGAGEPGSLHVSGLSRKKGEKKKRAGKKSRPSLEPRQAAVRATLLRRLAAGGRLQHQRRNPARQQQRNVVVNESGNDAVFDVVVLTVGIEAHCRAEGGVRRGRAGIAQRPGRADDGHRGQRRKPHVHANRHAVGQEGCGAARHARAGK